MAKELVSTQVYLGSAHAVPPGQGRCYVVSPELFSSDDEGFCDQRGNEVEVPPELEAAATRAVNACPEGAISLIDVSADVPVDVKVDR